MARINDIFSQALDANGAPLSGGKLYFYATGTSTPKTTYSDAALTTPNANPVVLDAAGVPGDIFYTGSAKVVLKDANDVQLRVLDPVDACCASEGGGGGEPAAPYWNFVTTEKTANWTAVAGDFYFGDLSSSNLTMTLPASPSVGDRVGVVISRRFPEGTLTINGNSEEINGSPSNLVLYSSVNAEGASLIYLAMGWKVYDTAFAMPVI